MLFYKVSFFGDYIAFVENCGANLAQGMGLGFNTFAPATECDVMKRRPLCAGKQNRSEYQAPEAEKLSVKNSNPPKNFRFFRRFLIEVLEYH